MPATYQEGDSLTLTMELFSNCRHHPNGSCPMGRISRLVCLVVPELHSTVEIGTTWRCRIVKVGIKDSKFSYLIVKPEQQIRSNIGSLPVLSPILSQAILKGIEQMSEELETKIADSDKNIDALQQARKQLQDKLNDIESKIAEVSKISEEDTLQLRALEEAKLKYDILSTPDCDVEDIDPEEQTDEIQNALALFNNAYK